MQRLTPLATAFLAFEDADPDASLAIGSFAVFEPPAPDFAEFATMIERRLPLVPRYRQLLRRVPFDLAAPVWDDDPRFDLAWHLGNVAVPPPGGRAEIGALISTLMSERMDRRRPLWRYWLCTGLPAGRWGLLSKLHHSMADGVSGTELYGVVLDLRPDADPPVVDDWLANAQPGWRLAARGLLATSAEPARRLRTATAALGSPVSLSRGAEHLGRGLLSLSAALRPVPESSLIGPLSGHRRYAWQACSLPAARAVARHFSVTVNDVALAAISGSYRRLLLGRGEQPGPQTLRSLVPVSTRPPGAEGIQDNQISLLLPYLPIDLTDPVLRLLAVHHRLASLRRTHEPEAGTGLTELADALPYAAVQRAIRLGLRLPQHHVATVTTNVTGPRVPLYCLGRRLVEILPYVPIADRVRTGVAIFSYLNQLVFGVTADYDTVPDIDQLAGGIGEAFAELADLLPEQFGVGDVLAGPEPLRRVGPT